MTSERLNNCSGGLGPARGREAPCTPGIRLPPSGRRTQDNVSRRAKCYRGKHRRAKSRVTEADVPREGIGVGPRATREYLECMRERYILADRQQKGALLDEAVAVTGRHRKSLIRAWRVTPRPRAARRGGRPRQYGPAIVRALVAIWTAAGYPWSLRLKALLPTWAPWARRSLSWPR